MQINLVRKILSTVLFIAIAVFLYFIFKKNYIEQEFLFLIFGIFLFSLFLFALVFTKTTTVKTVYKEGEKNSDIKTKKELKQHKTTDYTKQAETESSVILSGIQKHSYINKFAESLLLKFAKQYNAVQGITYVKNNKTERFETVATYALYGEKENEIFEQGEGINGQVAADKNIKIITDIPEGYINVVSGLGNSSPSNLLIIPFVYKNNTIALTEISSFEPFPKYMNEVYRKINYKIAEKFNTLNS